MELYERTQAAIDAAKKKGNSVATIAKACGITRSAVYQWCKVGAQSIDGANLVELAELSGLSPMWIAKGKGPRSTVLSTDENTILHALPLVSQDLRDSWLEAAKKAIDKASASKNKAA